MGDNLGQGATPKKGFVLSFVPAFMAGPTSVSLIEEFDSAARHFMRDFVNVTKNKRVSIPFVEDVARKEDFEPALVASKLDESFDVNVHELNGRTRQRIPREQFHRRRRFRCCCC